MRAARVVVRRTRRDMVRWLGPAVLLLLSAPLPTPAQVRPLVLEDPSRPGPVPTPPLLPPRRAILRSLWEVPSGGTVVDGLLATPAGVAFAVREGRVRCISPDDGRLIWETAIGAPLAHPPTPSSNAFLVASGDEALALAAVDGRVLWRSPLPSSPLFPPAAGTALAVLPLADGTLLALKLADGSRVWSARADCALSAPLGTGRGLVILGCEDGRVLALEESTARVLWKRRTGSKVRAEPVVLDKHVFVGNDSGRLICYHAARGGRRYATRMAADIVARPVKQGKLLLAGALDNLLYAYRSRNGHLAWSADVGSRPLAPPAVWADVTVSAPPLSRDSVVIDTRDGAVLLRLRLPGEDRLSAAGPVFAASTLVITTRPAGGGPGWLTASSVDVEVLPEGPALFETEHTTAPAGPFR